MPRWWDGAPAPARPELDCLNCNREWKCCAFQPFVPNFLLGAFLANGGDLAPMRDLLQPLGLIPGQDYRERYLKTPENERGEDFLCRFYDRQTRACKNWSYRPGECSTFFCKPGSFDVEQHSYAVFNAETAVAQMALAQLGFENHRISLQVSYLNDPEFAPAQVEFSYLMEIYRRSWDWAQKLPVDQVRQWTGELQWA